METSSSASKARWTDEVQRFEEKNGITASSYPSQDINVDDVQNVLDKKFGKRRNYEKYKTSVKSFLEMLRPLMGRDLGLTPSPQQAFCAELDTLFSTSDNNSESVYQNTAFILERICKSFELLNTEPVMPPEAFSDPPIIEALASVLAVIRHARPLITTPASYFSRTLSESQLKKNLSVLNAVKELEFHVKDIRWLSGPFPDVLQREWIVACAAFSSHAGIGTDSPQLSEVQDPDVLIARLRVHPSFKKMLELDQTRLIEALKAVMSRLKRYCGMLGEESTKYSNVLFGSIWNLVLATKGKDTKCRVVTNCMKEIKERLANLDDINEQNTLASARCIFQTLEVVGCITGFILGHSLRLNTISVVGVTEAKSLSDPDLEKLGWPRPHCGKRTKGFFLVG